MKNLLQLFLSLIQFLLLFNSDSFSQISGTYSIGVGGDYTTITSAVNALVTNGVNAPVIFNILSGNYDESVTIDSIPGTSTVNTITFKSQSGNANDVNWYSSNPATVFTLRINGPDYLTIQNVTFPDNNISTAGRSRIYFQGSNQDLRIISNVFLGGLIKDNGLNSSDAAMNNLLIDGNLFEIKNGISFKESSLKSYNTKITDNTFNCVYGMEINYHDSLVIEKNNIKCTSMTGSLSPSCIRLTACKGNLQILRNKLIAFSVFGAIDGLVIVDYSGATALIANNFVSFQTGSGIYIYSGHNMNIYHNSIRTSSFNSGDIGLLYCSGITSKNNIMVNLANQGTNSLTYYITGTTMNGSDYNNFYYINSVMARYSFSFAVNLAHFRTLSGLDLNSVERPVTFVSETDLHRAGASIGDTNLYGIPVPEVTVDIDGELRSTTHPVMGADEGDVPLPVLLASFTSSVVRNNVTLNWSTLAEQNNSGFEIHRMINGSDWVLTGHVAGNGTTNSLSNYSFSERVSTGNYYYRLKQVDFNGNFAYYYLLNKVKVGVPSVYTLKQNYPNPFNPSTKIDYVLPYDSYIDMKLYDLSGKEIAVLIDKEQTAGYYTIDFNGKDLSAGVYFYTIETFPLSNSEAIFESDLYRETRRMVLLK